ncbi:hypothetical protein Tsubulata_049494 [Turnera subulata]|uniref:Alpha/beta hydrolase fold-3 domain-containing protein n=1 Tax=Turnera subulata TaxID=218843 RepID=A0A9Q0F407_9ROSI|nr:hypothetical protein Tsubulata_049494 [Turnera subulata]
MASTKKEVANEILPFIRLYKDGSVERLIGAPYVPPSLDDPETGVSSKDMTISHNDPNISARIFLPKQTQPSQKLPILVYFHGGAFCIGSAFDVIDHRYMSSLSSQVPALVVSVEYRLAPEHLLPAAYEDSWAALQWVASHSVKDDQSLLDGKESWILDHGDFDRVFLGGDSAGANIVHNMVMKAGVEGLNCGVKILGAFMNQPYFWGSQIIGNESSETHYKTAPYLVWSLFYPSAPFGIDNPMVNPMGPYGPSLAELGCSRLLICVAGKDELRDRAVKYHELVKESGWRGELEDVYQVEGEDHAFHLIDLDCEKAKNLIKRLAAFLTK